MKVHCPKVDDEVEEMLHRAVLRNVRDDRGLHAEASKLPQVVEHIDIEDLNPALDGHPAILRIDAHGDPVAPAPHRIPQEILIRHGLRAEDDPRNTGITCRCMSA